MQSWKGSFRHCVLLDLVKKNQNHKINVPTSEKTNLVLFKVLIEKIIMLHMLFKITKQLQISKKKSQEVGERGKRKKVSLSAGILVTVFMLKGTDKLKRQHIMALVK